jgi:hypothetical protein
MPEVLRLPPANVVKLSAKQAMLELAQRAAGCRAE